RVHAAVHDAHRLAHARQHRQTRGANTDFLELVDLEANHSVEGVGPRQAPAFGLVGYVCHAADATCGSATHVRSETWARGPGRATTRSRRSCSATRNASPRPTSTASPRCSSTAASPTRASTVRSRAP